MLTEHIVRVCTVCVQSQAVIPGLRDEDEAARRDRRAIARDSRNTGGTVLNLSRSEISETR